MGFDPVTMGLFAIQAFSAIQSFSAQRKQAKATSRANAAATEQSEENARLAREEGAEAARQERLDAKRARSAQLASFLQSGVTLDGSPLLTLNETEETGERNSRNQIANAESRARSFILQGEANQQPVQKADFFGTAATVLGAANSAGAFKSKPKLKSGAIKMAGY